MLFSWSWLLEVELTRPAGRKCCMHPDWASNSNLPSPILSVLAQTLRLYVALPLFIPGNSLVFSFSLFNLNKKVNRRDHMRAQPLFYGLLVKVNLRYSWFAGSSLIGNNVSNLNRRPFEVPACFAFYGFVISMGRVRLGCVHRVLWREICGGGLILEESLEWRTADKVKCVGVPNGGLSLLQAAATPSFRTTHCAGRTAPVPLTRNNSLSSAKVHGQSQQSLRSPIPFFRKWHVFLFPCLVSLCHSETQSVVLFLSASPYHGAAVFFCAYPSLGEPARSFSFGIYQR